ncbi:hypothetical protein [Mycoplasma sp. 613B]
MKNKKIQKILIILGGAATVVTATSLGLVFGLKKSNNLSNIQKNTENATISLLELNQTNAKIQATINSNDSKFDNKEKFKITFNDIEFVSSNLEKKDNKTIITFELSNLSSQTLYKFYNIRFNDKIIETINKDFNFTTKKAAEQKVYEVETLEATNISNNSLDISFNLNNNENIEPNLFTVEVSDYNESILVTFNSQTNSYNFHLENLNPNTVYAINKIKYNNKDLNIKSTNKSFRTTTNELVLESVKLVSKTKNSAVLELTLNKELTNEKLSHLSAKFLANATTTITISNFKHLANNHLLLTLENLNPQTNYKLNELTLNSENAVLSEENKISFNTSKDVSEDTFTISNVIFKNVTETSATVRIEFNENELVDSNHHEFDLEFTNRNSTKSNDYNLDNNFVEINVDNLDFHTTYTLSNVMLNGRVLTLPTRNNEYNFTTKEWTRPVILNNLDYKIEDKINENLSDVLSLNFGIIDMFPLKRQQYFFVATLRDQETNEDTKLYFTSTFKDNSKTQLTLDNVRIQLSEDPESDGDSLYYDLRPNKNYLLKSFQLVKEIESDNYGTVDFTLKEGKEFTIDTHINRIKYQNVNLNSSNNNLNISLDLTEQSNENVQATIESDYGGLWVIPLTKTNNNNYAGTLNLTQMPSGNFKVSKVTLNNKPIFVSAINKGTNEIQVEIAKEKNNIINSINYLFDKHNYEHKISLSLNNDNKENPFIFKQNPMVVVEKNGLTNTYINLQSQWNKQTNQLDVFSSNLDFGASYKILGIGNIHINQVDNNSFKIIETKVNKNQLTSDQLNSFIDQIQRLELKKHWWTSGIKAELLKEKDLFKFFDLSNLSINKFDDNITFEFDENSFSNQDELNGTLTLTFKLVSGTEQSKSKTLNISNLYSQTWINKNKTNTNLFDSLVSISKEGSRKSTKEFDEAFSDPKYNNRDDLDSSFGKPSIIIELNDQKLAEFLDIDKVLTSYDTNKFKVYFVKYKDDEDVYQPHKTTGYAPLGMMQYKLMFWFNQHSPEDKYTNQVTPLWVSGYNQYTNKNSKDLFAYLSLQSQLFSSSEYKNMNARYGIKSTTQETADQMLEEINQKSSSKEKLLYLEQKTNLIRFLNDSYNILKDTYNPPVTRDYFEYEIVNVKKISYGLNNFLDIALGIKPIYLGANSNNEIKNEVINKNTIHIKLLNNN